MNCDPRRLEDYEAQTISSVMLRPSLWPELRARLAPEDFEKTLHAACWRAIEGCVSNGEPVDAVTVWKRVQALIPTRGIEAGQIADILDAAPHSENGAYYAGFVAELSLGRKLNAFQTQLAGRLKVGGDMGEIVAEADGALARLRVTGDASVPVPMQQVFGDIVQNMQLTAAGACRGVDTGLADLDCACGPLGHGQLIIVGARPAMGKSALALQIAAHVAATAPVLVFPLETGREQLALNLAAQMSGISLEHLADPSRLTEADLSTFLSVASRIAGLHLWVDDCVSVSTKQILARAAALKAKHGLSLIVVDYLQLIGAGPGARGRNREQEIAEISRQLKGVARELNVPLIACAQIGRAAEREEDKRPKLWHLRESGQIEADADLVLLLHREGYYDPAAGPRADVLVAKRKTGRAGIVANLIFRGEQLRFENQATYAQERGS